MKSDKNGQLLFGKAIVRQNGQKWPPLRLKLKVLKTHTQKKTKTTSELFYTQNGFKKEVIVKNNTILKSGKNGNIANAT